MWKKLICLMAGCTLGLAPVASAGLIGWWKLDEGTGKTARDSSGNKIDGALQGNAQWATGVLNGALQFDGTSSVDCGTNAKLQLTAALTIACWVNPARLGGEQGFVGRDGGYCLKAHGTGLRFTTPGILDHSTTSTTLQTGAWQHVAATFVPSTSGGLVFYLNGAETERMTSSAINPGTGPFRIGTNQWSEAFTGMIDDVRVYNRVLTAAQIKDLYSGIEPTFTKAEKPDPADGATGVSMPLLQWSAGDNAKTHNVYVGTSPDLTQANLIGPRHPSVVFYYGLPLQAGATYWWRIDEIEADGVTVHPGDTWHFTVAPLHAYNAVPRSGDKWIALDAELVWQPGLGAITHALYFGTDKDAVTSRAQSVAQGKLGATSFTPTNLSAETTYYWVVDEITLTGENPGEIWSFTTQGAAGGGVKAEYFNNIGVVGMPALVRTDPCIDFSWGNPGGPGAPIGDDNFSARWTADLEIAVADTYTFITNTDDGSRLWLNDRLIVNQWVNQGPTDALSKPIALEPGIYPLRMEYYENLGGATARLFWQTPTLAREIIPAGPLQPPVRARAVYPANGDVNVPQSLTLRWLAGEEATQHEVYFGDDAAAVAAADTSSSLYKGTQALDDTTFAVEGLEWNKTFYWRVDEVNDASAGSPWRGPVWSFTTADCLVIDDMESYNDEEGTGTRIYETWIDGYTDNLSGSVVGNMDPPFAEQTIVHGGKQSMPMDYNNVNSPYFSQAYREFVPLGNWTVNGLTDLSLWVRGNAARLVENPAGTYTITANSIDVWGTSDNFRFAYKTLTGDGAISAKVVSVTNTSAWAKAGVMIRDTLYPTSSYVFMFPTPDGRRAFQNRPDTGTSAISAHSATAQVTLPLWVKVERKGLQFTGYYSTDGKNWIQQPDTENTGTDKSPNPQMIIMDTSVCIGLAVASNNAQGGVCTAVFSDVVVTGGASFEVADIGSVSLGNDTGPLYVIVEDQAGKKATVVDPNAAAVNATTWTEWKIPLTDLKGVNLGKVQRLYLGVGDTVNPAADGYGRIYIDDIRVVKP